MAEGIMDLAASQHGVITRHQALRAGLTQGQWGWITQSDDWVRIHAGVYRRAGSPQTWEQTLMAGCLAVQGVASHLAAGMLWSLPNLPLALELTVERTRRVTLPGFEIHRARALEPVDRASRQGIPVTSLARTVIDVSLARPGEAPALVDHVLAKRRVPLQLLVRRLEAAGSRRRKGIPAVRAILQERAGRSRHVDSGLQRRFEELAIRAAKDGRLPNPTFECAVRVTDGRWRFPDVGYPDLRVGFEVQSYEHHSSIEAFARDQARNLELFAEGWIIVPVTARELRDPGRLVEVMARILRAVQARTPRPEGPSAGRPATRRRSARRPA